MPLQEELPQEQQRFAKKICLINIHSYNVCHYSCGHNTHFVYYMCDSRDDTLITNLLIRFSQKLDKQKFITKRNWYICFLCLFHQTIHSIKFSSEINVTVLFIKRTTKQYYSEYECCAKNTITN